jgi:hypothetical protein
MPTFLTKLIEKLFETNEGKTEFVPYGKFGKKYAVNAEQEKALKDFLPVFYLVAVPSIAISAVIIGAYAYIIAVPFALFYFIKIFGIVEPGLSPKERFNIKALIEHFIDVIGVEGAIVGAIAGAVMFLLNLKLFLNSSLTVLGLLGLVVSGGCLYFLGKYLYEKHGKSDSTKETKTIESTPIENK